MTILPESATQQRVIDLFVNDLGYTYLGNRIDREGNSNIEIDELSSYLTSAGYSDQQISMAIESLKRDAELGGRDLYHANQQVYGRLRYGVPVKTEAGKVTESVHLINWKEPEKNHFTIAEEVTLSNGGHERRPDLVLYINGLAIGVIELKRGSVEIGEGIRQLISNQKKEFNAWFFTTVQFVFAGNNTEGLYYGTTDTPEKYFLKWKEDVAEDEVYKLDKYLAKMCAKTRFLDLIHDFVLFDGGVKKVPRVHQYFGIKAAQKKLQQSEGGIIWHTQGSGKSIVMVLLAKWLLENRPDARALIVTDRDELDKQIKQVFESAGEKPHRTTSGRDLIQVLGKAKPRLICSLVHKFGHRGEQSFEDFIQELESQPSETQGEVFVFVDECHRTQSGKLHRAMKAFMPNAIFVGFTGTPLLKKDKATTFEVFGRYIHTYKFAEAVEDEVVLDLIYEARDIDQNLGSQDRIDQWFEAKTAALNDWQKDELKKAWATRQKVLSSKSRMEKIVQDIIFDFSTKPRLQSHQGNAILVAKSIYEAARYYELFQATELKNKCAVVTSYDPKAADISKEDIGADTDTEKRTVYKIYTSLLEEVEPGPKKSKTETYEDQVKKQFCKEPALMRLLIVVDKLLTGFDAPPCTYLYIDKRMQDHGLFQAICRTNRLDGDSKTMGYVVDYQDLFTKVEKAIAVYASDEIDVADDGVDPNVMLKDRLEDGRERLDNALEKLYLLCEPVEPPKGELQYIQYFCGNVEVATDLSDRETQRIELYKGTVSLIRSYANIADDMDRAGYSQDQIEHVKSEVNRYTKLRETIRLASGEHLDLKPFEADMRHLIDSYIEAKDAKKISPFDDIPLLDLIVKTGIADAIAERLSNLNGNEAAVAETIENNVRSKIIKEQLTDPTFYETMSELLDEIIKQRLEASIAYQEYLKKIHDLVKKVDAGMSDDTPDILKQRPALRAVYNHLNKHLAAGVVETVVGETANPVLDLAQEIDRTVIEVKPADFRGNQQRENQIKEALLPFLQDDEAAVEALFEVITQQSEY